MTSEALSSVHFFSEEVYARVLHASPVAFSLSTLDDGRYLEVNDRFLHITGYTRDEVIGRRSTELGLWATPADRARVVEALRNQQPVDDLDLAVRTKSGELRYVRAFFEPVAVENQRCIFSLFYDISERREAEDKYHSLFDHAVDGIFRSTPDGRLAEVNPALARIFGYDSPRAVLEAISDIAQQVYVDPQRRAELQGRLARDDVVTQFESQVYRRDGSVIWVAENVRAVRDVDGRLLYYEGTVEDITERKRAESQREAALEALRASEQHLQTVLMMTADAVYDWDVRSGMTRWNHGLQSLFGYAGETLRAHAWWEERIHPDDLEQIVTSLNQTVAQRGPLWSCEYRYRRADGSYAHVIDRGYFMYDEDGRTTRMVGVMVDITDRVQLAEAQVRAALEERRRLARDLHDSVAQSLYSLTLLAEATRRLAKVGDLERVEQQVARLGETAQQTLKEMRLLVYELRPQPLEQEGLIGALQQRLDAVEKRSGVNARLIVETADRLPEPIESALYFIAQEALNNALKHSGATGVTIKLGGDRGRVQLDVTDNGRGFDQAAITDRGGLGLTSMRERAEQLGGTLTLESAPDRGAHVTVNIPWQEAAP